MSPHRDARRRWLRGLLRWWRSPGTVLLVGALALHALYLVGDRTWWGEWVSIWPPVGWLVLALPAVIRRWSLPALVLLVALALAHGELPRFGSPAPAAPAGETLRIVTWNVSGRPSAWNHLRPLAPDVVAVQESAGPPRPLWEGYEWHGALDPGVLTRFPAEPLPTRKVGPWTEPQLLRLSPPGTPELLLVNVRLSLPSIVTWVAGGFRDRLPAQGHRERVGQYRELARLIAQTRRATGLEHVLLVGDFNAPARMPSLSPLRRFLRDCWRLAGRGWGGTATADLPLARIDHCWVSPEVGVLSARTARFPVSDHRALFAEVAVASEPRLH